MLGIEIHERGGSHENAPQFAHGFFPQLDAPKGGRRSQLTKGRTTSGRSEGERSQSREE